jgi:membrane protein YdbS with pleckstrin-like domain
MRRPLRPKNWMGWAILIVFNLIWLGAILALLYFVWTRVDWSMALMSAVILTYCIINTRDIQRLYRYTHSQKILEDVLEKLRLNRNHL